MADKKLRKQDALDYHSRGKKGKIEVVSTKSTETQRDLSLAYSPGVAYPCLEIEKNPNDVYKYTAKGNLVGVISNGTAVLGLGNIGASASKPVMEGKGVLFKIFADIDVFDIEINETDPEKFIQIVKSLEPTFGGINLEDIKSPEAFEIEKRLRAEMNIPLMHDDQHGTAIISGAALLNALELADKKIDTIKVAVSGAGAAALSCVKLWEMLGVKKENITLFDKDGQVSDDRNDMDPYKSEWATPKKYDSFSELMKGADVMLGLSVGGIVTQDMIKSMAKNPIVFALANPNPEISYAEAIEVRDDIIMATGRSDNPNQVNNVLGFPYIFRGALDVRATEINEDMKLAAVRALAELTKEPVPEIVNLAYNEKNLTFDTDYIIPKPTDPRLIDTIAPAVAKAAMDSGMAQKPIEDWEAYKTELRKRLGLDNQLINVIHRKAKQNPKTVVFAEAEEYKILKAAQVVRDEGIAEPILLGNEEKITALIEENELDLHGVPIINPIAPELSEKRREYAELYFKKRGRRGVNFREARSAMRNRNYFGCMMLESGEADAFLSGLSRKYPDIIRPALQIIGKEDAIKKVAGMYIMLTKQGPIFFADTTVNVLPSAEDLADIVHLTAREVRQFNIEPRIAMLSYSNFGSADGEESRRIREALAIIKKNEPELQIDGEVQANFAFDKKLMKKNFPFSNLINKNVNTLIFPNLSSGNIAYKLIQSLGGTEAIGPILMGLKKPVHILQMGSSVREIVNMAALAVVDAQGKAAVQAGN